MLDEENPNLILLPKYESMNHMFEMYTCYEQIKSLMLMS